MSRYIEFGNLLKHILTERDIRGREFSSLLNIDQSLVYRWLRGERLPSEEIITQISDTLSLTTDEKNNLSNLVMKLKKDPVTQNMRMAVDSILNHFNSYQTINNYSNLIDDDLVSSGISPKMDSEFSKWQSADNPPFVYEAKAEVLKLIIGAIDMVRKFDAKGNNRVYLSFQFDAFFESLDLFDLFVSAIRSLLNDKPDIFIEHIVKVSHRDKENIHLFHKLLQIFLECNARYQLHCYGDDNTPIFSGMVLTPFVVLTLTSNLDAVFVYKSSQQSSEVLIKEYMKLKKKTEPLFLLYSSDKAFTENILELENLNGYRLLFKDTISKLVIPERIYEKFLIRTDPSNINDLVDIHKKRLESFSEKIKEYVYIDVYDKNGFENFIKTGLESKEHNEFQKYSDSEVIIILENMLELLANENYYIFFSDRCNNSYFLEIKESSGVMIKAFKNNNDTLNLICKEEFFIDAFNEYFNEEILSSIGLNFEKAQRFNNSLLNKLKNQSMLFIKEILSNLVSTHQQKICNKY